MIKRFYGAKKDKYCILKHKMKYVFLILQEEIALQWIVMMSLPVNYFEPVPSVFAKCVIKCLLLMVKPMGVPSNDDVFKSYSQCNEHMIPSKRDSFFATENNKKMLIYYSTLLFQYQCA